MFEYYWWYENYAKLDRIYYILIMFSADINSTFLHFEASEYWGMHDLSASD